MGFTQCVPPWFRRAVLGVGNYQQGLIGKHLFCLDGRYPVFVNALCRVRRIPVKTSDALKVNHERILLLYTLMSKR